MNQKEVPQIFDTHAQALARRRAKTRMGKTGPSFLLNRSAEDAASRIADINRQCERGAIISAIDMRHTILADLPKTRHPKTFEWHETPQTLDGEYDLIIDLLNLQSENDLPNAFRLIRSKLKADGLFMAALFGGDTLTNLRQTFYQIDQMVFKGATARVYPMIDHQQAAGLLGHAGLNLPVVDKDRVSVSYKDFMTLVNDLRDLALTNTLLARHKKRFPKGILQLIETAYPKTEDGKYSAQFEILWLTGWSPHESQQKPLKPGSAKTSLAESLRGIRDKKEGEDTL